MTILTRAAKGSELTHSEVDTNFTDLRDTPNGTVRPKTKGIGTKVDLASPTWPWRDLEGQVTPRVSAPNNATLDVWNGNIRRWSFNTNDVSDNCFHLPHDYVPGSDLFVHVHWGHNGTAISGSIAFRFYHTYAKGHGQAAFPTEKQLDFSLSTPSVGTVPRYQHIITEAQLSSASPTASQLDSSILEVDGLIMGTMQVVTLPSISGGTVSRPFVFYVDLHYQSTEIGTKQKAPDFWT